MRDILIYDRYMAGKPSSTYGINLPTHHRWLNAEDQYGDPELAKTAPSDVVVYSDHCIQMPNKIGKVKIGWLIEPEEYFPWSYSWARENYKELDYIFTWRKCMLAIDDRFKFLKPGNSWITREEAAIYPKTKVCSMIASNKAFMAGHLLRRQIFQDYSVYFDRYGRDTVPLDNVIHAYKDYMFTVVVENVYEDNMFTEKLVTPLLCGTIPVYSGCPNLSNFFDMRGIIVIEDIEQMPDILGSLSKEKYEAMLPYARTNFDLAKKYQLLEDDLYEKLLELKVIK